MDKRKFKLVIYLGAFLIAFAPLFASAASVSDLQKQKDALTQKIKQQQEQAAQKKKEAAELQAIVSQIDKDISATQNKINNTQSQIDKTQKEIDDLNDQIAQKEKELAVEQSNQDEAIRVMYETVNKSTLEVLAGSENISEVVTYGDYLETLESKIENTIAEIDRFRQELRRRKEDLENKKKEFEGLKTQLQDQKNHLNNDRSAKSAFLGQTKAEEGVLKDQIAQAKKEQATVDSEIAKALSASGGVRFSGEWALPLSSWKYVSCEFHCLGYPYPWGHTGIDFAVGVGAPIYAASDGVIRIAMPPVGPELSWILIDHGGGFSTAYLHMSEVYVGVGDKVVRGQVMGRSGGMPGLPGAGYSPEVGWWSTGPHLHFEVRVNGVAVNPRNYFQF